MCEQWSICILAALAAAPAFAAAPNRMGRTAAALNDLERVCRQAEQRNEPTLPHRVHLVVGRLAMAGIERAEGKERDAILDRVYENCLQSKLAVLEAIGSSRRLDVPAAPELANVRFQGAHCVQGERLVFPVVADQAPEAARAFFAQGELVRIVPALAGATPETVEQSEVLRVHRDEPASRRVGWDRPAGGFVRDASAGQPAILTCVDHRAMREAIARETAKALAAWPKDARPLYASLGSGLFYVDYSELSGEKFAYWLKERYKLVRALNAAWNAELTRFGPELMPTPEQAGASPARWRDWAEFNQWRFTDHARWACGNVRSAAPDLPLGLGLTTYAFAGSHALSGVDPVALADLLDVIEVHGADAMGAELAVALAGDKRPVVDAAVGPGAFGVLPHFLRGCAAARLAWSQWPMTGEQAVADAERALREAIEVRRLTPTIAALSQAPRPVALLYSQASMRQTPALALRCAESPHSHELARAYQAARFLDVGCTFLASRDLLKQRWSAAGVLIVAGAPFEEDRVVRELIDYVELGGRLVVIAESLVSDERGGEADYLMRLGVEVLKTSLPSYRAEPRPERGGALDELVAADVPASEIQPKPDGLLAGVKRPLRGAGPRQTAQVNVLHKVAAAFPDGSPAIVTFERGKGSVTYLAMPLEPQDLAVVLRAVLAQAGAQPLVRTAGSDGEAWGVECRSVKAGSDLLAYVWNTTAEPKKPSLVTKAIVSATNLSTGAALPIRSAEGGVAVGPLRLGPFETALVRIATAPPRSQDK